MMGSLFTLFIYFILIVAVINLYNAVISFDLKAIVAMLVIIVGHFSVVAILVKD